MLEKDCDVDQHQSLGDHFHPADAKRNLGNTNVVYQTRKYRGGESLDASKKDPKKLNQSPNRNKAIRKNQNNSMSLGAFENQGNN